MESLFDSWKQTTVKLQNFGCGKTEKVLLDTLVIPMILYGCEVWECRLSKETWRKVKQILTHFIINNLKIKCNIPYPVLLLKVRLPPIKSKVMIKYLMYKHKLTNMKNEMLPITTSNISKSHSRLKKVGLDMQFLG